MNIRIKHLIDVLTSWETGYLPASALIVMKECKETIIAQHEEIESLKTAFEEYKSKQEKPVATETPKRKVKKNEDTNEEAD